MQQIDVKNRHFIIYSKDEDYWKMHPSVIDGQKERLWDGLIAGLERYNEILTERAKQIQNTDALRQQVNLIVILS